MNWNSESGWSLMIDNEFEIHHKAMPQGLDTITRGLRRSRPWAWAASFKFHSPNSNGLPGDVIKKVFLYRSAILAKV